MSLTTKSTNVIATYDTFSLSLSLSLRFTQKKLTVDQLNSNRKHQRAMQQFIPSFELLFPSTDHCLAIINRLCSSLTKCLQSSTLFSNTSGSPADSQKSELQACSAHSLETAEIWRPLQAEMVFSVMEAILKHASFAPFSRRLLSSRYHEMTSTSRVG